MGTCQSSEGNVFDAASALLEARGHTVEYVDGTSLDTPEEIEQYDVVVFGAGELDCDWDWYVFDGQVQSYVSGGGGAADGATVLITEGANECGAAWEIGSGRSVYLGPVYLGNWDYYENEPLLDGSLPNAELLFLRAVEWAGGYID